MPINHPHPSLKNLCEIAKDTPLSYAPGNWAQSEKAIWCMGFCEALTLVLAYIDGRAMDGLDPQSGTRPHG